LEDSVVFQVEGLVVGVVFDSVDQVEELMVGVVFDSVVLDSVFLVEVVETQVLLVAGVVLTSLVLLLLLEPQLS